MTKTEEFLSSIGVSKETIEALNQEPEEGKEIDIATYTDAFKTQQRDVIQNDPDFINPINKAATGKERAIIEQKIKKVLKPYMSEEEIDKLTGNDEYFSKIGEVIESNKNHNADSEKLQNDLIESNKVIQELKEVEIPRIHQEADAKHKGFIISTKLKEKIAGHELIVPSTVGEAIINTEWNSKYNLDLSEDGTLGIKTKDGTDVLNEGKTGKLTIDELMKSTFEANKILKQSGGSPDPTPSEPVVAQNGSAIKGMPHLNKL